MACLAQLFLLIYQLFGLATFVGQALEKILIIGMHIENAYTYAYNDA